MTALTGRTTVHEAEKMTAVAITMSLIRDLDDVALNELLTCAVEDQRGARTSDDDHELSKACLAAMRQELDDRLRRKAIQHFNVSLGRVR